MNLLPVFIQMLLCLLIIKKILKANKIFDFFDVNYRIYRYKTLNSLNCIIPVLVLINYLIEKFNAQVEKSIHKEIKK
jgi:hypothetical protein